MELIKNIFQNTPQNTQENTQEKPTMETALQKIKKIGRLVLSIEKRQNTQELAIAKLQEQMREQETFQQQVINNIKILNSSVAGIQELLEVLQAGEVALDGDGSEDMTTIHDIVRALEQLSLRIGVVENNLIRSED